MIYIVCLIVSVAAAFAGSLLGLGGGILFVPIMLFLADHFVGFSWATPQAIVGLSLLSMVFTTLSSSISNYRRKLIDTKLTLYLITGSIPGGILGSYLNRFIHVDNFPLYFGSLLMLISLLFFIKPSTSKMRSRIGVPREATIDGVHYTYFIRFLWPFLISFFVGSLSGLFGIGGGSMVVPTMILLFGVPAHIAIATSLGMIIFTSSVGSITHIMLGHINWQYVAYILAGAWIGGWLGARVNQIMKARTLIIMLQVFLILVGLYLILDSLF